MFQIYAVNPCTNDLQAVEVLGSRIVRDTGPETRIVFDVRGHTATIGYTVEAGELFFALHSTPALIKKESQ